MTSTIVPCQESPAGGLFVAAFSTFLCRFSCLHPPTSSYSPETSMGFYCSSVWMMPVCMCWLYDRLDTLNRMYGRKWMYLFGEIFSFLSLSSSLICSVHCLLCITSAIWDTELGLKCTCCVDAACKPTFLTLAYILVMGVWFLVKCVAHSPYCVNTVLVCCITVTSAGLKKLLQVTWVAGFVCVRGEGGVKSCLTGEKFSHWFHCIVGDDEPIKQHQSQCPLLRSV